MALVQPAVDGHGDGVLVLAGRGDGVDIGGRVVGLKHLLSNWAEDLLPRALGSTSCQRSSHTARSITVPARASAATSHSQLSPSQEKKPLKWPDVEVLHSCWMIVRAHPKSRVNKLLAKLFMSAYGLLSVDSFTNSSGRMVTTTCTVLLLIKSILPGVLRYKSWLTVRLWPLMSTGS